VFDAREIGDPPGIVESGRQQGAVMSICRNCRSTDLRDLGFIGEIAPFFLRRVYNLQLGNPISIHPLRESIRKFATRPNSLLSRIFRQAAFVEMQICNNCLFVQAKYPFGEEAIGRLYADYRAESYNSERIKYEPPYKAIADRVGADDQEVTTRVEGVTRWLLDKIQPTDSFTMLDYGGADGRFLPRLPAKKFVFEISNISPVTGVTRIADEAALGTYSYIHLAHVLEHVVDPLKLVIQVAQKLEKSGYLYIEVPQEMSDVELDLLKQGSYKHNIPVHEHINKYCITTVTKLMERAGLELIAIHAERVDVGWAEAIHLRSLCRKH
jgi:Methyltransferase domain